ncbi:TonB-dependent receptor [soil metagenome]
MTTRHIAFGASAIGLVLAAASAVHAQETTGTIRGTVTRPGGGGVAGATVTIKHAPSGTTATAVTSADGYYSARGLRVGGPYVVTVTSSAGGDERQISTIGVGDPTQVDFTVGDTAVSEVVVSGRRQGDDFGAGTSTNVSASEIGALASISRDIKDVARTDPFAMISDPSNDDAFSFAGVNTRLNQLTIDGIRQNDEFGLNNNGYPTQRSPISLESIQAVNVSAAPFSVINNGFIGGSVNAVTKSGTNKLSGSVFYEYSDANLIGDTYVGWDNRTRVNNANNPLFGVQNRIPYTRTFEEKIWGASLGGPVIRDRVFLFGSYEKYESTFSLEEGPADGGFSTEVPRITPTAIATFNAATKARYNYDPLSYVTTATPVLDEKYLLKLDANITDSQRLSLTFQETKGNSFNGSTGSVFVNGDSITQPRVGLNSSQYTKDERLTVYNAQLNSQWRQDFSTELRFGYKETETTQIPLGGLSIGQVTVNVPDLPGVLVGSGTPQIQFGADNFRHDNYLYSENTNLELIGRYNWGQHDFLFGFRSEKRDFLNVFVSQSLGTWNFNSYADFLIGKAGSYFLRGAVDPTGGTVPATQGTARAGSVAFGYYLNSLYAEDSFAFKPTLNITYGFRYDWFSMKDRPVLNNNFVSRNGFANTSNVDGVDLLMPRAGFDWTPGDWKITGGLGRFSAIGTNVQIGNPFGNDGARITNAVCPAASLLNVTDFTKAPAGCTFTPGSGNVVALDPNFKVPSAWKFNLSVQRDFDLPKFGNLRLGADFIYTDFENALYYTDIRAVFIGLAPDGRPAYGRKQIGVTTGNEWDLLLTNLKDGGQSKAAAFTASKYWASGPFKGLDLKAVYTYTRAEDGNPMTSSQPDSSYVRFASSNHNLPRITTSDYEIRNRFVVNANYTRKFFGDNETTANIFAQYRSGNPYSFVYHNSRSGNFDNDFGNAVPQSYSGAFGTSNQLFYVPTTNSAGLVTATSDPRITYAAGFDLTQFNAFLKDTGLIKYSGTIAPRNAWRNDPVTTIDLRLSQQVPAPFVPTGKFKIYADIENLGNMLNDRWGVFEKYPFYPGVGTVVVQCGNGAVGACALPGAVYTYSSLQQPSGVAGAVTGVARRPQAVLPAAVWQVKLGLRFDF